MKPLIFALSLALACGVVSAQKFIWQPSAGHKQVEIWPGTAPDQQPLPGPEYAKRPGKKDLIAGKQSTGVWNVSRPTMTVYSPKANNSGVAVVVYPGGGYQMLAIDLEGTEVCDWLTAKGITCVLLQYRVPATPWKPPYMGAYPSSKMALDDAQRTMGLLRFHAAEWHIDPHKIGVLGFSAGGSLVAEISTHFVKRIYQPVDPADKLSCRPDFAVALYPGHLWIDYKKFELNPYVPVTRETPPTFMLQAEDDHVDNVNDSLVYYIALRKAGVPVEMHLYAHGGHAFGLRHTRFPITDWPQLVDRWLVSIGMVEK